MNLGTDVGWVGWFPVLPRTVLYTASPLRAFESKPEGNQTRLKHEPILLVSEAQVLAASTLRATTKP
eukprot:5288961-Amphidinium_carterae.1